MGMVSAPHDSTPRWDVACHLELDVTDDAAIVLQVVPASTVGTMLSQSFEATLDGRPVPVRVLDAEYGGVLHVLHSPPGALTIDVQSALARTPTDAAPATHALDLEQLTYLRQSRYCPSDRLGGFAAYELGHIGPSPELLIAVGDWVASRLTYVEGSSGPLDTAVDSLFAGQGVCRDFAHLAITMLRALDVPSRLVAVYAPGLSPMDFHAVVEAHVDGCWWVLDPTRLAPRTSLLRIATGRDAADTAFLTVLDGEAELHTTEVQATTDGDLDVDDHLGLVRLA
jgi:transglutaminase-like putative cysteine protease